MLHAREHNELPESANGEWRIGRDLGRRGAADGQSCCQGRARGHRVTTMANRPAPIRKAEIQRIVKGVIATGLSITRIDVEGGKIVIHTGEGLGASGKPAGGLEAKHGQS